LIFVRLSPLTSSLFLKLALCELAELRELRMNSKFILEELRHHILALHLIEDFELLLFFNLQIVLFDLVSLKFKADAGKRGVFVHLVVKALSKAIISFRSKKS
jgi:hypothetical protein